MPLMNLHFKKKQ